MTDIVIATAIAATTMMVALWLVSLPLENASIVDIAWGPGFAIIAWTSYALADTPSMRALVTCVATTAWAARLAVHIGMRNTGHGEDRRYRAMRQARGPRFPLISLFTVFLLQAALMWIISLPLQAVHLPGAVAALGWMDAAGLVVWNAGYAFEAVADAQLTAFRKDPANKGRVMDRGLWAYSRHPNYFGECVLWWGFGLVALAAGAWWALIGPLTITFLLLKVSGVTLLESTITERRPGYREYIQRTSAFVPRPPRSQKREARS